MKRNNLFIALAVGALVLATLACNAVTGGGDNTTTTNTNDSNENSGFSFTTANLTNVHMATDENDSAETTVYAPDAASFYCFFDLNNAPESTVVTGTWVLVSADGYEANSEIDSAEVTGSDSTYYFSLDRSVDAWPIGQYKIDLYIDGSLVQTINFEVQ